MILFGRNINLPAALVALGIACSHPAHAQNDIGSMIDSALKAMEAGNWEEALALSNEAVGKRDPKQLKGLFGTKFGIVYYRKGIAEMKLGKWSDALSSFDICYREFANDPNGGARENPFEKLSLLRSAEAATSSSDWQSAIDFFVKFRKERHPVLDRYDQGRFHISLAICYFNLDKVAEGEEQLKIAIDNKISFPTSDAQIMGGFQEFVSACLSSRDEARLLAFIEANRGGLLVEPYLMQQFSKIFLKLAADTINANMERSAIALYQMIPDTGIAIDDIRAKLRAMDPLPRITDGGNTLVSTDLEQALAELESQRQDGTANETIKLAASAFLHEKHGDVRSAYAAYKLLETQFPNAKKREDNLFNLARTSSIVGTAEETRQYSEKFISTFPDSHHIPALRRIMLASLFYDGEYDQCIEIGERMKDQVQPGTPEHDMCTHVLGGSYFITARFEEAQPWLDQHVKEYPESQFAMAAAYFQASNLYRLGNWSKAGELLDAFIQKYPNPEENEYLPLALFDRANCHSSLEETEQALKCISRLIRDFPNALILDQAYMLRGNIEQTLNDDPEKAEQAYLTALDTAV
ncbi:MAG: tetratricopeptide repeat protein, partial [Luteolibacter sp.]